MTRDLSSLHATAHAARIARSSLSVRSVIANVQWKSVALGWMVALATGMLLGLLTRALGWWNGAPWEHAFLRAAADGATPAMDAVMLTLPVIGTNYALAPLVVVAAIVLARRGYASVAVHLIVVQLGSWILNPVLKFALMRPRPELYDPRGQHAFPAFPSGHMIAVVAVLGTVAWLLQRAGHGRRAFAAVGAFFLLVGWSRIYLGVHWPTDVIGGTLVGLVWLVLSVRALAHLHPAPGAPAWHENSTSRLAS